MKKANDDKEESVAESLKRKVEMLESQLDQKEGDRKTAIEK